MHNGMHSAVLRGRGTVSWVQLGREFQTTFRYTEAQRAMLETCLLQGPFHNLL